MMNASMEMPRYKCHKEVHALKIVELVRVDGKAALKVEGGFSPIVVGDEFCAKHKPAAGGYYVVYADGYKSFSPAKSFEDGYVRVN